MQFLAQGPMKKLGDVMKKSRWRACDVEILKDCPNTLSQSDAYMCQ